MTDTKIKKMGEEDISLKEIFGNRFHDETEQGHTAEESAATPADTTAEEKTAHSPASGPAMGKCEIPEWKPPKPAPNWLDNLKASAKSALTFGGLNILLFYWEQIGLMDESVAVPSMCVCAALAGYGVGKAFAKECRR